MTVVIYLVVASLFLFFYFLLRFFVFLFKFLDSINLTSPTQLSLTFLRLWQASSQSSLISSLLSLSLHPSSFPPSLPPFLPPLSLHSPSLSPYQSQTEFLLLHPHTTMRLPNSQGARKNKKRINNKKWIIIRTRKKKRRNFNSWKKSNFWWAEVTYETIERGESATKWA